MPLRGIRISCTSNTPASFSAGITDDISTRLIGHFPDRRGQPSVSELRYRDSDFERKGHLRGRSLLSRLRLALTARGEPGGHPEGIAADLGSPRTHPAHAPGALCWRADGSRTEALRLPVLVQIRGEGGVAGKESILLLVAVARDHRLQHVAPSRARCALARPQVAALQVAERVEHEERVVAGAPEVAVACRASCSPEVGFTLLSMSRISALVGRRDRARLVHCPDRSARAARIPCSVIVPVSKRSIWLVEAPCSATERPPMIQRRPGRAQAGRHRSRPRTQRGDRLWPGGADR
jgi:hypothetical protein